MTSNQNKVIVIRHKQSRTSDRVPLTKYSQTVLKIRRYGQRLTQGYPGTSEFLRLTKLHEPAGLIIYIKEGIKIEKQNK